MFTIKIRFFVAAAVLSAAALGFITLERAFLALFLGLLVFFHAFDVISTLENNNKFTKKIRLL